MISHNGYYGCRVCEFEGIYYYSDRTCTYPWSIYVQTNPPFRTRDRFESCLKEAEYLKNIGDKNINVFGIKGVSPLNRLLFIPTQAIYDYFYLCLEGHMKVLLKEWNDIHVGTNIETCAIIAQFDDFLCNIDYPHSIHRRVQCFRSFNDWKATQLRLFLIYLALPFLLFFNHYFPPLLIYHFSLYAIYIRILCHFNEKKNVYDARLFIETHLCRFPKFYPMSKQLLSTHYHIHLWQQKMSMSTVSKNSASQRVVMASSTSATQYRSSSEYQSSSQHQSLSQHQSSSQHQPSNSHQSPSVRRSSNFRQLSSVHEPSYVRQPSDVYRPSSQATNYFGPIRSSIVQDHSHTLTSSYNQQRASPYTTNSPRTIRRQGMCFYTIQTYKFFFSYRIGGISNHEVNIRSTQCEEEFTRPASLVTVDENVLHVLLNRSTTMENEIRTLKCTNNQILKIARKSVKDQE
ncbi:unnamed protein product, partial [Rotaria sp. Silwood1]